MSQPKAFQWTFDRSEFADDPRFATFSLGVYQWIPKTSGDGLKKSKSIRVKGYIAEPDRVYEKAEWLCQRLNEECVNAGNPPEWVQKQYSVPKPEGRVDKTIREDLSGSIVRRSRIGVMAEHLIPAGFTKGKGGTYIRDRDGQIHLIDFQPGRWAPEYTVNLGFHYSFLPPFFHRASCQLADFHLLDCAFQTRIGKFIGEGKDGWFRYGNDLEKLKAGFTQNAKDCLSIFGDVSTRWADSRQWISRSRRGPGRHWWSENFELFLACLEIHHGNHREAAARLRKLTAASEREQDKQFYVELMLSMS